MDKLGGVYFGVNKKGDGNISQKSDYVIGGDSVVGWLDTSAVASQQA